MKFNSKYKKVIVVIFLFLIIFTTFNENFNTVYGKINEEYSQKATAGTIDVEKAIDDAVLIDYFAHFVYVIAGWLESLVMMIIKGFTGVNAFPWADSVIFNTIPFLDINFLSPAEGSMFKNSSTTIFGDLIKGIYNTIFVLAMAFFGVVVGIMAIKLAISSIASEKAKYKEAIKNWVIAIILLFTTHYLISFIFFINEKLVEVASTMLKDQIETVSIKTNNLAEEIKGYTDDDINNALDRMFSLYLGVGDTFNGGWSQGGYRMVIEPYSSIEKTVYKDENGVDYKNSVKCIFALKPANTNAERCMAYIGVNKYSYPKEVNGTPYFVDINKLNKLNKPKMGDYQIFMDNTSDSFKYYFSQIANVYKIDLTSVYNKYMLTLMVSDDFNTGANIYKGDTTRVYSMNEDLSVLAIEAAILTAMDQEVIDAINDKIGSYNNGYASNFTNLNSPNVKKLSSNEIRNNITVRDPFYWRNGTSANDSNVNFYEKSNISAMDASVESISQGKNNSSHNLVGNIGQYFKEAAHIYERDEKTGKLINFTGETKFNPIGGILYAIFVIQSLMFFIAYIKRFFYVIVLALFAPFVILYDFLMKSVA